MDEEGRLRLKQLILSEDRRILAALDSLSQEEDLNTVRRGGPGSEQFPP